MPTKYRVSKYSDRLEALVVVRETEKQVVFMQTWGSSLRETKSLKRSQWHIWFDTKREAVLYLLGRHERGLSNARALAARHLADIDCLRAEHADVLAEENANSTDAAAS